MFCPKCGASIGIDFARVWPEAPRYGISVGDMNHYRRKVLLKVCRCGSSTISISTHFNTWSSMAYITLNQQLIYRVKRLIQGQAKPLLLVLNQRSCQLESALVSQAWPSHLRKLLVVGLGMIMPWMLMLENSLSGWTLVSWSAISSLGMHETRWSDELSRYCAYNYLSIITE